jgi:hypothetical protein
MDRAKLVELKERIALSAAFNTDERDFILAAINAKAAAERPGATAYLDPGNYLGRIEVIWAALSVDAGGEGVCAAPMGGLGSVPLIAADRARLDSIMPMAKRIADIFGKPVRIAKFTKREDVQILQPG